MTMRSVAIGRSSDRTDRPGFDPNRAAQAKPTPSIRPTHHVAMMPHPKPRSVGSSVGKMGGWPMVKYSTQTRAVT